MEDNSGFQAALEESIEKRKQYLEKHILPEMRTQFQVIHNAFKSIYNILLKKGMIQEDIYKYGQKISEVTIPPQGSFMESEKATQMGIRLSQFESQIDFVLSYYQFGVDFLNMNRIKLLISLVKYFHWDQLSESSANLNTRTLAEYLGKIKKGTDSLSISLITDSQKQLEKASKQILAILKELTSFQREVYKLYIRKNLLSYINLDKSTMQDGPDAALKYIKRKFAEKMSGEPFYPELIKEILNEDYSSLSGSLREDLFKKLAVREEKAKTKKEERSFKSILLDGLRILSTASLHLEEAVRKLNENNQILSMRKISLGERLRRWLRRLVLGEEEKQIFEVEYIDDNTGVTRTEKIDYDLFTGEVLRRAKILANLSSKMTTAYSRLEASQEDQIYRFLDTNLEDIKIFLRQLPALDTFFRSEIPKEQRSRARGIKLEVNAIKNAYIKANQKKHEYVARKEEIEQLKKLGIDEGNGSGLEF